VATLRRPIKRFERTRSRKNKAKEEEEEVKEEKKGRVGKPPGSSRRNPPKREPPGIKPRVSSVTSIEKAIKELALRFAESIEDVKEETLENFRNEFLAIKLMVTSLKGDSSYLFRSTTGKYLTTMLNMLDIVESKYQLDVEDMRNLIKVLEKDVMRIVVNTVKPTNQFLNEIDMVKEYVYDPDDEEELSKRKSVSSERPVARQNSKRRGEKKGISSKNPIRGTGHMRVHHPPSPSERSEMNEEEVKHLEPSTARRSSHWKEPSKDKGTTRSGKLIAGTGNIQGRILKPVRHESETIDKNTRKSKIESPEHIQVTFQEDLNHPPLVGGPSEDLKLREELPEEFKQTSRKVLKKIAKELEKLHNYSKLKAQDTALKLEGRVLSALLADPSNRLDNEKLLNAYKADIVILIRNLTVEFDHLGTTYRSRLWLQ
jgi:hypothetical protein